MPRKLPIFYSALLLTGVNLLLRLVGTSFQVYISATLGAAGVGLLQLTMSVGSLALVAGTAGVRTASMYLTAEELGRGKPGNVGRVLSACTAYSLCFSVTVAATLYALAPRIAEGWIQDACATGALRLFAVFLPAVCLCGVLSGCFTAANRIGTLAAVEIAEQLFSMAVTLLALKLWAGDDPGRSCQSVILGSSLGACLTLCLLSFLRAREDRGPCPAFPIRQRLLGAALPLALADILKAGISTGENLMVPRRLALNAAIADPLAAFGTLSGMVFPVLMFPACILFGLAELLIPELARCAAGGRQRRVVYLTRRSLKAAMVYGALFAGLMFLLAEPLCLQLYGSAEAGQSLRRYALLIPMLYCDAITDAMTKGLGQQESCVRYNILTSSLDVALLYLLLPRYGMEGYFVSFLVTHLLNFCLSLGRLLKITGQAVPVRPIVFSAGALAAAIAIVSRIPQAAGRAGCFPVVLLCLLTLLGVVGMEDLHWLMGLLRRGRK